MEEQQSRFASVYRAICDSSDENTLNFFKRDFSYCAHGDHATKLALQVYRTLSVVRVESGLEIISLSRKMFSKIAAEILNRNHNIQIWQKNLTQTWEMTHHASPGNIRGLESELGVLSGSDAGAPAVLASLHAGKQHRRFGMAICLTSYNIITILDFEDDLDDCIRFFESSNSPPLPSLNVLFMSLF